MNPRAQQRVEALDDAVRDGHPEAVAQFAHSLAEGGELGACMELTADTTAAQMVERYISDIAGQRALHAWAEAVIDADTAQAEAERGAA